MKRLACVMGALLASGCVVGPDYRRPEVPLPGIHLRASPGPATRSIADVAWWEVFGDPRLVALIEEALTENLDLRIAAAQILEARAQLAVARAPYFPELAGQVVATRTDQGPAPATDSFFGALALSWELDFWGRYRRATEAARAALLATEAGRFSVIASLVATVAQQYLQIVGLRQRLEVVQRTVGAQRDSLRLVSELARQGVQSAVEVRQAESQLLATEAQVPALERTIAQAEHALAFLLGKAPRTFDSPAALPPPVLPPVVPAGVPSDLLARRPDIHQAEQQLIAANANIGVARAAFFPRISLTASLGRVSDALRGLVRGEGETVTRAEATANVPIYTGGALTGNLEAARARATQAVLAYRRAILVALQEVSDALVAYERDRAEAEINRRRVEATGEYLRLSNLRFRSGVISYLEVLDAQRQLLAAELDLNASELALRLSAVQLYRALGGGWQPRR